MKFETLWAVVFGCLYLAVLAGCDASVEGDAEGECSDGADNDQDGNVDCADDGCASDAACAGDDDDSAAQPSGTAALPATPDFDGNWALFVVNENNTDPSIVSFLSDGASASYATGIAGASGLAQHPETGVLYVSGKTDLIFHELSFGTFSSTAYGVSNPNALAFDESNNLLVAESGSRISSIDLETGTLTVLADGFDQPQAIASHGSDLYFTDFTGFIFRIQPDDVRPVLPTTVEVFTTNFLPNTEGGLVIDSAGNLYASHFTAGKVFKVTPDGQETELFELENFGPRGLALTPDDGQLFVTGFESNEIVAYDLATGALSLFEGTQGDDAVLFGPFGLIFAELPLTFPSPLPPPVTCSDSLAPGDCGAATPAIETCCDEIWNTNFLNACLAMPGATLLNEIVELATVDFGLAGTTETMLVELGAVAVAQPFLGSSGAKLDALCQSLATVFYDNCVTVGLLDLGCGPPVPAPAPESPGLFCGPSGNTCNSGCCVQTHHHTTGGNGSCIGLMYWTTKQCNGDLDAFEGQSEVMHPDGSLMLFNGPGLNCQLQAINNVCRGSFPGFGVQP